MRKNITKILEAFVEGKGAIQKTCRTDGKTIWSYNMPICQKLPDGSIELVESGPSLTTNGQISACYLYLHLSDVEVVRVKEIDPDYQYRRIQSKTWG